MPFGFKYFQNSVFTTPGIKFPAYYLTGDTSYLVAKAEVVNKSPITIFVHGDSLRMRVPVLREWYERDTSFPRGYSKDELRLISALPIKLHTESTYELYPRGKFPFRDLWQIDTNYIEIPSGERKILFFPLPKRMASYRLEAVICFNKEQYWFDCTGQKVTWPQYSTIQSNKIDLIWKDTLLAMDLDSVKTVYGNKFFELRQLINNRDPLDFLFEGEPKDVYEPLVKLIIVQLSREMTEKQILDLAYQEFKRWFDNDWPKQDAYIELTLDIWEWIRE